MNQQTEEIAGLCFGDVALDTNFPSPNYLGSDDPTVFTHLFTGPKLSLRKSQANLALGV